MEIFDVVPQKRLLAFCINFPQDLPVELKQTFNKLLNSTLTTYSPRSKNVNLEEHGIHLETCDFKFQEKPGTFDIYTAMKYVMVNFQRGKDRSIAYGIPHYGFDIVFVEVYRTAEGLFITDSYMIQNAFIQELNTADDYTSMYMSGFFAENLAVNELAKTLIEQNSKPAPMTQETTEATAQEPVAPASAPVQ